MSTEASRAISNLRIVSATTIVFVLICLLYGLTYIVRNNVSTVALVFERDLRLTNAQIGLVYSVFAYPYLIFQILGGWVSDRFGARLELAEPGLGEASTVKEAKV